MIEKIAPYLSIAAVAFFALSYFGVVIPWFGIFFIVSLGCIATLLFRNNIAEAIRVLLLIILVQNFAYALGSSLIVRIIGESRFVELVATPWGQMYSLIFLEGKLLFFAAAAVSIFFEDIARFIKVRKMSQIRFVGYLLLLVLGIIGGSQLVSGSSFMAVIGSLRNYSAVIVTMLLGSWVAQKLPQAWETIFARNFMIPLITLLSAIQIGTIMIFSKSIFWWQEYVGVRYLYFAKLFFETLLPQTVTEGRFYTDLLGINFVRTGGIYLEPVNYGYVLAFLFIWLCWACLKYRKTVDFLLLIVTSLLFIMNMGKGALLFVMIVAITYLFIRIVPERAKFFYALWVAGVVLFALGIFAIAPLLSKATLGHTEPVEQLASVLKQVPEIVFIGDGLGTNGNFTAAGEIRESALAVAFVEIGGPWLLGYFAAIYAFGQKIFSNKRITPLLVAFSLCGIWSLVLSGLFQENIFSLQVSFFTLFAGMLFGSSNFEIPFNERSRK